MNDKEQIYSEYKELVLEAYPETDSNFSGGMSREDRDLDNIKTKIDRLREMLPLREQEALLDALWADIQSALETETDIWGAGRF